MKTPFQLAAALALALPMAFPPAPAPCQPAPADDDVRLVAPTYFGDEPIATLSQRARDAYERQDWALSAELHRRLAERGLEEYQGLARREFERVHVPSLLYASARSSGFAGDPARALASLDEAVRAGFLEVQRLENDPAFAEAARRDESAWRRTVLRAREALAEKHEDIPGGKVVIPRRFDHKRPAALLVALHPYGTDLNYAEDLWGDTAEGLGMVLVIVRGSVAIAPNRFVWDLANFNHERQRVFEWIEKAKAGRPNIDRVVLTGYSQGAAMAWALVGTDPTAWTGLVSIAASSPYEGDFQFHAAAAQNLAVCALVGEDDSERVTSFNREAKKAADYQGVPMRLREFRGVGHGLPPRVERELKDAIEWVEENSPSKR